MTMMECGHVANATRDGKPVCAIHAGIGGSGGETVVEPLPLDGRQAQCSQCHTIVPSSSSLPFFEFRGEGSRQATESCGTCGYYLVAHENRPDDPRFQRPFTPRGPWEFDGFYCGCRGWD